MLERPQVPDLLIGSALCIVSIDVVDDSTREESVFAEIVDSTAELGVPCVVLGGLVERDAAYWLLRAGVRAITPLGHPRRPRERARLTCRDSLEWHAHHATTLRRRVCNCRPQQRTSGPAPARQRRS